MENATCHGGIGAMFIIRTGYLRGNLRQSMEDLLLHWLFGVRKERQREALVF